MNDSTVSIRIGILFCVAIVHAGCSSSSSVSASGKPDASYSYAELNEELRNRVVTIESKDGANNSAKLLNISADSVSWVNRKTTEGSGMRTREVNDIVLNSPSMGALEGVGFGLVIGGGAGAIAGQLIIGDETEWGTGAGLAVGAVLGGTAGLLIGTVWGLIEGHDYHYEFQTTGGPDPR